MLEKNSKRITVSFSAPKHIIDSLDQVWQEKGFGSRSEFLVHLMQNADAIDRVKRHRELTRDRKRRERAKKLTKKLVTKVCAYCGDPSTGHDHIIPKSRGGTDDPDNLVESCLACNSQKTAKPLHEFLNLDSVLPEYSRVKLELVLKNEKLMSHLVYDGKQFMSRDQIQKPSRDVIKKVTATESQNVGATQFQNVTRQTAAASETTQRTQASISKAYQHKKSLAVRAKFPYVAGELDVYQAMMHHEIKQSGVLLVEKADGFRGVLDDDLVYYAIEQSDGKNVQYVLKVLTNFLEKGYQTLADHPDFQRRESDDVDQSNGRTNRGGANRASTQPPEIIPEKAGWRGRSTDS